MQSCYINYDDFTNTAYRLIQILQQKAYEKMNIVMCHPQIKKHIIPKVQIIWDMFPFNILCCPWNTCLDACLCPYLWYIMLPLDYIIVLPWNIVTAIILITIVSAVSVMMLALIITIPATLCLTPIFTILGLVYLFVFNRIGGNKY